MRSLIDAAAKISSIGYEGGEDVDETITSAEDVLLRVRTGQPTRDFVPLREVLDQYMQEQAAIAEPSESAGAPHIHRVLCPG